VKKILALWKILFILTHVLNERRTITMKNLFKKFMGEKRGDVVQYIIVLAVVVVILVIAYPKIKASMTTATTNSSDRINEVAAGGTTKL